MNTSQTPAHFSTRRSTLLVDRFMNRFVRIGGLCIIVIVTGIFVFILWETIPLFLPARVQPGPVVPLPAGDYRVLGVDEWTELPFVADADGRLHFADLAGERGVFSVSPEYSAAAKFTAMTYCPRAKALVLGTAGGEFCAVGVDYHAEFEGDTRTIRENVEAGPFFPLGPGGLQVQRIAYRAEEDRSVAFGIVSGTDGARLYATLVQHKSGLLGPGRPEVAGTWDLSPQLAAPPVAVAVGDDARRLVAADTAGEVYVFERSGSDVTLRQRLLPFGEMADPSVSSVHFLFGGASLIFTNPSGAQRMYSVHRPENAEEHLFGHVRDFPPLPGPCEHFAPSLRNKGFLTASGDLLSLRYGTTGSLRWRRTMPGGIAQAALSDKYNSMLVLDDDRRLHVLALSDPHPEASFAALFGKVWYEGYNEPEFVWQSTGGTDEFEPKLSMIPLISGTLKGTFFAMVFAIPIALLAAVYASDFMHRRFRVYVKPTMEVMASLPSVVLGFLAALWLAPMLELRIPSVLLMAAALPLAAILLGGVWSALPPRVRLWIRPGHEFLLMAPVLVVVGWAAWQLGPWFERIVFTVTDPDSGTTVADFRRWWPAVTGTPFEQRNSLVVGFMMGFAVIPIIFTIAEDSLSNVPNALRSGSMALGANRWQTALKVVLPTASPGIFSGVMIGLGRAVGETMIVVMATGNTPILSWNPFSGMRTLSANIAVELPEAPQYGTLYRTLFLGALILFMMTFVVNTIAEVMRQHLRNKYKTV